LVRSLIIAVKCRKKLLRHWYFDQAPSMARMTRSKGQNGYPAFVKSWPSKSWWNSSSAAFGGLRPTKSSTFSGIEGGMKHATQCMTDKIKIVHPEGTSRRIDDSTPIVRYMKLETLLLLLFERQAFIPSHATSIGPTGLSNSIHS
jgi:hypothetical protein